MTGSKGKGKGKGGAAPAAGNTLPEAARALAQAMMKEAGKVPASQAAKLAAGESLLRRYRAGLVKAQARTGGHRDKDVNDNANKFVQWVQTKYFDPVEDPKLRDSRRALNRMADQLAHGKENPADWITGDNEDDNATSGSGKKKGKGKASAGGDGGDDWATVGAKAKASPTNRGGAENGGASGSGAGAKKASSGKKAKGKGDNKEDAGWEEIPVKKGGKKGAKVNVPAEALARAAIIAGSDDKDKRKGRSAKAIAPSEPEPERRNSSTSGGPSGNKKKTSMKKKPRRRPILVGHEDKEATSAFLLYTAGAVAAALCALYVGGMLDMFME